jgi:hypothetical protein
MGRAGLDRREIGPRVEHEQVMAGAVGWFMKKRQRAAVRGRRAKYRPSGRWVAGVVHREGGLMSASAASPAGVNKKPPPVGTGGGESGKTSLPSQCARNGDDNGDHGRRSEERRIKRRASEVHERKGKKTDFLARVKACTDSVPGSFENVGGTLCPDKSFCRTKVAA